MQVMEDLYHRSTRMPEKEFNQAAEDAFGKFTSKKVITIMLNWDLWIVSVNSGEVRQLTDSKTGEAFPCWSPDGRTIAFASDQSGAGEIHLIPAEGGEAKQ